MNRYNNSYQQALSLIDSYRMRKLAAESAQAASSPTWQERIRNIDWTSPQAVRVYSALAGAGIGGLAGGLKYGGKGVLYGTAAGAGLGYGGAFGAQRILNWLKERRAKQSAAAATAAE